ncbi:MAG: DUF4856 domain-containing protein [Alphaproteobacteria bacterium]|nr:DUF4856 domain-containing protein [Alphaproteobacteria bacterium]
MSRIVGFGAIALAGLLVSGSAYSDGHVYSGFPVTVKGYEGSKNTSVSYTGQIARHVLHDSIKVLASQGTENTKSSTVIEDKMLSYFSSSEKGREIIAPKSKGVFIIKQEKVDDISGGKNLSGKTYSGQIAGMPGNMTGAELVEFWINKASRVNGGVDIHTGYNYPQLISKFVMGAVSYNQAVDNYLDEKLTAENKPNDKPYKDGAAYTGKEHSWDEAFGYFGAPAHTMALTAKQVYEIAKLGSKSKDPADALKYADHNNDGVVDLKTEMVFGPAYYAASFDKGGKTSYLHNIMGAYLDGRKVIIAADGNKLSDDQRSQLIAYASTISSNWEAVLAEATFKYAGSVYKDMAAIQKALDAGESISKISLNYYKHWGELKGFSLSLQVGKDNLGGIAARINRLIGYGPLLPNLSQVVDIDSKGAYQKDQGSSWGEYMLHMLKLQKLLAAEFPISVLSNNMMEDISSLAGSLGDGASAEND